MMQHFNWNNAQEWFNYRIETMSTEELKSGIQKLVQKITNQEITREFYHEMQESGYHDERIGEQWPNASKWLISYTNDLSEDFDLRAVLTSLRCLVTDQVIQEEYQDEMKKDGFFDPSKEVSKEDLSIGSIVQTYSQMSFLVIHSENGKRFKVVDLTNIKESKVNAPEFDTLDEMYDWFQSCEDDGIESIIPYSSVQSFLERMNKLKEAERV